MTRALALNVISPTALMARIIELGSRAGLPPGCAISYVFEGRALPQVQLSIPIPAAGSFGSTQDKGELHQAADAGGDISDIFIAQPVQDGPAASKAKVLLEGHHQSAEFVTCDGAGEGVSASVDPAPEQGKVEAPPKRKLARSPSEQMIDVLGQTIRLPKWMHKGAALLATTSTGLTHVGLAEAGAASNAETARTMLRQMREKLLLTGLEITCCGYEPVAHGGIPRSRYRLAKVKIEEESANVAVDIPRFLPPKTLAEALAAARPALARDEIHPANNIHVNFETKVITGPVASYKLGGAALAKTLNAMRAKGNSLYGLSYLKVVGGYSDIDLCRDALRYEIERLKEIGIDLYVDKVNAGLRVWSR